MLDILLVILTVLIKQIISTNTIISNQIIDINKVSLEKEIVNRHDFEYILNPADKICTRNSSILVIVYVHSAPGNLKRRISIRETWAKQSLFTRMRLVFMLGVNSKNLKIQKLLELESNVYGDLVQENFEDSYKNLTYKGIMSLKWIAEYCSEAKYVLKVDDDIIVNTFTLFRHLKSLQSHELTRNKKRTVMCLVWNRMLVQRQKDQKWYLSYDEYKYDYFGKYCSGSAFLYTR